MYSALLSIKSLVTKCKTRSAVVFLHRIYPIKLAVKLLKCIRCAVVTEFLDFT